MNEFLELTRLLRAHFPFNLARVKCMAQFVLAIIKVATVCQTKLAQAFVTKADPASSEKRIYRFLKDFHLDMDAITRFVILQLSGKVLLTLDRTTWEFGNQVINVLMLAAVHKGVAVPLMWIVLEKDDQPGKGKKGNSHTQERIKLMEQFIGLFGIEKIEGLCADREFIGSDWFSWLKEKGIAVYIRIRNNQEITNSRGRSVNGEVLFRDLKPNESRILKGKRKIGGKDPKVHVIGMRLPEKGELLIVVCFDNPEQALETYALRWQIETMFACLKSKGFRFESTHLKDLKKIEKLMGLVTIAFVWCYIIGDRLDRKDPIPFKNHGYRSKSIFRYGFDYLRKILLNAELYAKELKEALKVFERHSKYFFRAFDSGT